jgi:hypothetical protein
MISLVMEEELELKVSQLAPREESRLIRKQSMEQIQQQL